MFVFENLIKLKIFYSLMCSDKSKELNKKIEQNNPENPNFN